MLTDDVVRVGRTFPSTTLRLRSGLRQNRAGSVAAFDLAFDYVGTDTLVRPGGGTFR